MGVTYAVFLRSRKKERKEAPRPPRFRESSKVQSVATPQLEVARKEVKTLLLEKELLATALTRVYEAEADGNITKDERAQLSGKYRDQLRKVEDRLGDVELHIEVGELERLRDELIGLFDQKMTNIETRLEEAKVGLNRLRSRTPPEDIPVPTEEKKVEKRKPKPVESQVDERVKELREEVLTALTRLEEMDIEG